MIHDTIFLWVTWETETERTLEMMRQLLACTLLGCCFADQQLKAGPLWDVGVTELFRCGMEYKVAQTCQCVKATCFQRPVTCTFTTVGVYGIYVSTYDRTVQRIKIIIIIVPKSLADILCIRELLEDYGFQKKILSIIKAE